jgi:hypothetical protein
VLFICEKYYLRFYRPIAHRLVREGFSPIWVALDGVDVWDYDYIDPTPAIETLVDGPHIERRDDIDALCRFERAVFERPNLFKANYSYTINVVRTLDRARRLAAAWYESTLALLARFQPHAVFVWNGRYLPYRAVSAACDAAGQLLLTSEIGWIPGTVFLDRGSLSSNTTDLMGRTFESTMAAETDRADAFLKDYTTRKATMVSQTLDSPSAVRQRLLGKDGTFLLVYGCQVDWDTNVVIGARRFLSNETAVSFLMECASAIPGARLVVKTHPLDSETDDDRLREILGGRGTVVSDIHPHTLIEAADCIAVRNSTLGFEALCYQKPLLLLEVAKYKHPKLTLDARSVEEGSANLLSVSTKECTLPDPVTLRRFVLHLLDHYLVPARYDYFFEPAKLELLSHLGDSESYPGLLQLLRATAPPRVESDDGALRAVGECALTHPQQQSFLSRQVRKLSDWVS